MEYKIGPILGEGATSTVYRAEKGGKVYALKLMKSGAGDAVATALQFRLEASVLARLSHPSLVEIIEVGDHDGRPYFIMEMVEGESLAQLIQKGPLSEESTLHFARGIAGALNQIHRFGLVHRDIKPGNILIDKENRARLIDFGFAVETKAASATPDEDVQIAGTFLYCPPEQSNMLKRPVDGRSDLYALGAVILECLTQRPPFQSERIQDLIQQHANVPAPDLRELRSDVRPVLAAIVAKLLKKDPDDRYQTAEGLLLDFDNLSNLDADERKGQGFLQLDSRQNRIHLTHEIPLVGRELEIEKLRKCWNDALKGVGSAVQIEGESGSGKTRLSQELLVSAVDQATVTLRAKCQQTEYMPFGVLREAIDEYIVRLQRSPDKQRDEGFLLIKTAAGEFASIIKRLSRGLDKILGDVAEVGLLDPASEQERFFEKISDFLLKLSLGGPLLIIIDDTQWIDPGSLQVLKRIANRIRKERVLLLMTARNDESSKVLLDKVAREIGSNHLERIVLAPLNIAAVEQFVSAFLGGKPLEQWVIEKLNSTVNGNAFAVGEYIQAMLDSGILTPVAGKWQVNSKEFEHLTLSNSVLQLIVNRIKLLSTDTLAYLRTAAVYGMHFELSLLTEAAKANRQAVMRALDDALRSNLVERQDENKYSFVHDRVGEALVESLTEAQLKEIHQSWAETLEQDKNESPERIYALARHYAKAVNETNLKKVYEASLNAAKLALQTYANEKSYEVAKQGIEAKNRFEEKNQTTLGGFELYEIISQAAIRLGRFGEAQDYLANCLSEAKTGDERARLYLRISLTFLAAGEAEEAWKNMLLSLEGFSRPVPKTRFFQHLSSVWFWFLWTILFKTGLFYGKAKGASRAKRKLISETVPVASGICYYRGRMDLQAHLIMRELVNSHFLGVSPENARAITYYAFTLSHQFQALKIAQHYGPLGVSIAEQTGDLGILYFCRQFSAIGMAMAGDIVEATKLLREAIPGVKKYNGSRETTSGLRFLASFLEYRGLSREVIDLYYSEKETLSQSKNVVAQTIVLGNVYSQLSLLGRNSDALSVREEWMSLAARVPNLVMAQVSIEVEQIFVMLDQRDFSKEIDEHIAKFLSMNFNIFNVSYAYVLIAYVRLHQFWKAEDKLKSQAWSALKTAVEDLKKHGPTPAFSCHLWVIKAAIACAEKKYKAALKMLGRAELLSGKADSPWGHYEILCQRARIQKAWDNPGAAKTTAESAREFALKQGWKNRTRYVREEFGLQDETAVSDNHSLTQNHRSSNLMAISYADALLRVSLASSKSLDPDQQASAALDELVRVLAAERAFLFISDDPNATELKMRAGRSAAGTDLPALKGYSSTVVKKVWETRKALVVNGTDEGEVLGSESAVVHDLRSIIAAPIMAGEKPLGVVYLDSRLAKGLFTSNEVDILSSIANHIGISIQTASIARLEAERRSLEKDLALTAAVQLFFLPSVDSLSKAGFRLSSYYQPASQAGGDWWWCDSPTQNQVSLLVGDITGHGAASAMLTASMTSYLLGLSKVSKLDFSEILLGQLNEGLVQIAHGKYWMTMTALTLDASKSQLTWWTAGAPPFFTMGKDKKADVFSAAGGPLGSEHFSVGHGTIDLEKGSRVLVFTDGLPELMLPDDSQLGIRKLKKIFADTADLSIDEAKKHILQELGSARQNIALMDDLTFILIDT